MSSQERTSYFLSWSSSLYKNFKYHLGQLPSSEEYQRRRRRRRRHHHHHRNPHYNVIQVRSSRSYKLLSLLSL